MNRRKIMIALCAACALMVSAVAAQGALAVEGTTLQTCVEGKGNSDFSDADCSKTVTPGTGKFGHVEVAQDLTTHISGEAKTTQKLKATIAGSPIELSSPKITVSGSVENKLEGKEHYISGKNIVITYHEVTENLLGCTVTGKPGGAGKIETKSLQATTLGKGMGLEFKPTEGTVFAEFELTGCIVGPLNVKVVGSIICRPGGLGANHSANLVCNHEEVTAAKSLRLQNATTGPVAGYEGTTTISGGEGKPEDGKPTGPLSVTTKVTT